MWTVVAEFPSGAGEQDFLQEHEKTETWRILNEDQVCNKSYAVKRRLDLYNRARRHNV